MQSCCLRQGREASSGQGRIMRRRRAAVVSLVVLRPYRWGQCFGVSTCGLRAGAGITIPGARHLQDRLRPKTHVKLLPRARTTAVPPASIRRGLPIVDFQSMGINALGEDAITFLCSSVLVYPICRQTGASPLLGFLLAGVLLQQMNLFAQTSDEVALADFGVLCLLFQIGLELTIERLQQLGFYALRVGLPALVLSTAFLAFLELPPGQGIGTQLLEVLGGADPNLVSVNTFIEAITLGLGLSLSSSAFVLQLLRDQDVMNTRIGNAVVGVLLLQDIAVVPLLALLPVIQMLQEPSKTFPDSGEGLMMLAAGGLKAVSLLCLVAATSRFIAKPLLSKTAEVFGSRSDALTASVLVTVVISSICTKQIGLSDSLGAFLTGTLLADSSQASRIEKAILPFKGLLLGLFFVTVGSSLDLQLLIQDWRSITVLLIGVTLVKATTFIGAARTCAGLTWYESVRLGLLLAQGGEFAFVVFQLADDLGVLPDNLNKYLLIVIALSIALTPLLDSIGVAIASRVDEASGGSSPTETFTSQAETSVNSVGDSDSSLKRAPAKVGFEESDDVRYPIGSLPFSKELYMYQRLPFSELLDALLVGLGCLVFALRTLPDMDQSFYETLLVIEDGVSIAFLLEYLLRWWARGLQFNYLLSLPMVLNFLSFLPFVLKVIMPQLAGLELNFLRLLRVLSIYRFLRYDEFMRISSLLPPAIRRVKPWQLEAARVVGNIFTITFIVAGVIYDAEHSTNPQFGSFFDSFYFTTTSLSTLGLGDIVPITPAGRAITSISVLLAIGLIPFQLGGVAKALADDGGLEDLFTEEKTSARDL